MRYLLPIAVVTLLVFAGCASEEEPATPTTGSERGIERKPMPEEKHFGKMLQLTFGGENAEAYWSFDETKLIFQSTRPPFTADQIFVMDADGAKQTLVSTGKGRTTCAYFLPGDKKIVYA